MSDQDLWFIREGEDDPLGKWEVWFRPVRDGERRHGHFPIRDQAQTVVDALNELSRKGIRPDPEPRAETSEQGDGDPRSIQGDQGAPGAETGTTEADKGYG